MAGTAPCSFHVYEQRYPICKIIRKKIESQKKSKYKKIERQEIRQNEKRTDFGRGNQKG